MLPFDVTAMASTAFACQDSTQEIEKDGGADSDPIDFGSILGSGELNSRLLDSLNEITKLQQPRLYLLPEHHWIGGCQSPFFVLQERIADQYRDPDDKQGEEVAGTDFDPFPALSGTLVGPLTFTQSDNEIDASLSLWDHALLAKWQDSDPTKITAKIEDQSPVETLDGKPAHEAETDQRRVAVSFAIRGRVLFGMGVFDLALADLQDSLTWHEDETVLVWRAECLYQMGRYDEVATILNKLSAEVRQQLAPSRLAAYCQVQAGQFNQALKRVSEFKATDQLPSSELERQVRAQIKRKQEQQGAEADLKLKPVSDEQLQAVLEKVNTLLESSESEPRNNDLLTPLKILNFGQLQRKQWSEAAKTYALRIRISEHLKRDQKALSELYRSRGQLYLLELNQRPQALADLQQALSLNAQNGAAWRLMSSMMLEAGQFDKAAEAAELSIRFLREQELPVNRSMEFLATAFRLSGKLDMAFSVMIQAAAQDPESPLALLELCKICSEPEFGKSYLKLSKPEVVPGFGEGDSAWVDPRKTFADLKCGRIRIVLEASTRLILMGYPQGHRFRAEALTSAGLTPLALGDAQQVVGLEEATADDWRVLTNCLIANQKFEQAVEAAEKTREVAPENPQSLAGLGMAYHFVNRNQEALVAFQSALDLIARKDGDELQYLKGAVLRSRAEVWLAQAGEARDENKTRLAEKAVADLMAAKQLFPDNPWIEQTIDARIRDIRFQLDGQLEVPLPDTSPPFQGESENGDGQGV